jgi:hypothetical protein
MRAPRVTRHTSIRYSSSCHTRVKMGASIFFTSAMIRAFRQELEYRIDVCHVTRGAHRISVVVNFFRCSCGCEHFH